jgi:hypothetical protein
VVLVQRKHLSMTPNAHPDCPRTSGLAAFSLLDVPFMYPYSIRQLAVGLPVQLCSFTRLELFGGVSRSC